MILKIFNIKLNQLFNIFTTYLTEKLCAGTGIWNIENNLKQF